MCPQYLAIGMTADEYWNGDPDLVKAYRKAEQIRLERQNYESWVQGAYIYEALCDAAPVFRDFVKNGTKPRPYRDKPFDFNTKPKTENQKKQRTENGRNFMKAFAEAWNKKFLERQKQKKGGGVSGEHRNP